METLKKGYKNFFPKKQHKISVRLYSSGWIFIFLTIAIGFAAVNSGNNIMFLIVSMLLSFMLLSGFIAFYNLTGLELRPLKTEILTAGKESIIGFELKNKKKVPVILIELRLGDKTDIIPILPASKTSTLWLPWTPPYRGMLPWPVFLIGSSFPFGFIWRGWRKKISGSIIAAPSARPYKDTYIDEKNQGFKVERHDEGHGEWLGIRPHKPGEGPGNVIWKKIDWQSRKLRLFPQPFPAHHFASNMERPVRIDWHDPEIAHLDTETRLKVLRYYLEKAFYQAKPWFLTMPGGSCYGFSKQGREKALRLLALHQPFPRETDDNAKPKS